VRMKDAPVRSVVRSSTMSHGTCAGPSRPRPHYGDADHAPAGWCARSPGRPPQGRHWAACELLSPVRAHTSQERRRRAVGPQHFVALRVCFLVTTEPLVIVPCLLSDRHRQNKRQRRDIGKQKPCSGGGA
jgi:hypothetical protein